MDCGVKSRRGKDTGGIIGLAKAVVQYREPIEYDLLTMTGHEFTDIGRSLSWDALDSFLSHAAPESALMRTLNPELTSWSSITKTNAILADIFDLLANINANLIAVGSRKPAKKPKPYPRPKTKQDDDSRHFGSGGLKPAELRKWIEEKRARHAGSSTGDNTGDPGP